jgi:hypothetical protein
MTTSGMYSHCCLHMTHPWKPSQAKRTAGQWSHKTRNQTGNPFRNGQGFFRSSCIANSSFQKKIQSMRARRWLRSDQLC